MSNTDSFIEEVTEEVRRDKLYGYLRRYGWIGVAVVVVLVGGAAFSEYQRATARAQAQNFGDALFAALQNDTAQARVDALQAIETTPENLPIQALLTASEATNTADGSSDPQAARTALESVASNAALPEIYRDMARIRLVLLGDGVDRDDRLALISALSVDGHAFRIMAQEQRALIHIQDGEPVAAIDLLNAIASDAESTQGQRQRAAQLIVSLGGELDES